MLSRGRKTKAASAGNNPFLLRRDLDSFPARRSARIHSTKVVPIRNPGGGARMARAPEQEVASPEIDNQKSIVVLLTQESKQEAFRANDRAIDRTGNLQAQSGIFPTKPEQIAMQVAECAVPLPLDSNRVYSFSKVRGSCGTPIRRCISSRAVEGN